MIPDLQLAKNLLKEKDASPAALATLMLNAANKIPKGQQQEELARLVRDPQGKAFVTHMTDQCFRSQNPARVADQLIYLLKKFGIPKFLSKKKQLGFKLFRLLGKPFAPFTVPVMKQLIRHETASVILPEESLAKHIRQRQKEGVQVNLNHLGEAILGEKEAEFRLKTYLHDLQLEEIDYLSIKISTLFSQINLLAWNTTLDILADRFRVLLRAAKGKFINLDMEEYRDLDMTVALFKKVLSEPEFHNTSAGIVLQSYLPDSFTIQQDLTQWAIAREGAPIKIRIVKGANLAMEKVESSIKGWEQAPYLDKLDVDANFKRMVEFGCRPENAKMVHIGIGSHNLFDIAFALILRERNGVNYAVSFEMLEGMAENIRQVVQEISGSILLYCPAAKQEEFQHAVAYLMRRLDENTAPENFLTHLFDMNYGSGAWVKQASQFEDSLKRQHHASAVPRRTQDRLNDTYEEHVNEPDTDWSLKNNREWAQQIVKTWSQKALPTVELLKSEKINHAIVLAERGFEQWSQISLNERCGYLKKIARVLHDKRADLIGVMMAETNKTLSEADAEVSEAIDFATYYANNIQEWMTFSDLSFKPKGLILIAPPWNFPLSIPAGGTFAALATGNAVLLKPASEALRVGLALAEVCWEAGIPKNVLQFIPCSDDPEGSQLVKDHRISAVILTGATETAKAMLKMRPGLDLNAETGGKNSIIVTSMADRDLAVKDIVQSAFGHSGQKCSACSLLILEAEVYDDPHFRQTLLDAAQSLGVGQPWDLSTRVNPLIRKAGNNLERGLTTLEFGEHWLLQPKKLSENLWTPGIKWNVSKNNFTHKTELFGPVLGVMRANHLKHAIELANATPYGLTAGLHSLDEREHNMWIENIVAGNLYINRGITGAIVGRQPFGGTKESSFGKGYKAGGPNYLLQLLYTRQKELPKEVEPSQNESVAIDEKDRALWEASIGSYTYYWKHYFSQKHSLSTLLGQDNYLFYTPHPPIALRVQDTDSQFDVQRVLAAAAMCKTPILVSDSSKESDKDFLKKIHAHGITRVRLLSPATTELTLGLANGSHHVILAPVMANGRIELLNYMREVSLSIDYHRYGNLGLRENG
jgi:RHH-type proline utilization regulon transcriptional repressor/proline dehydrogenase/delta 1-pyrroline-5-carboxylate dehydrogenase